MRVHEESWEAHISTLGDQAIFGPNRDWECACGKYRGSEHGQIICDRCGVKVMGRWECRTRYGHIDLPGTILHPLGEKGETISAIPILPAALVESIRGIHLADCYDTLIESALTNSNEKVGESLGRVVEYLLPAVIFAYEWNLQELEVLAWGLALIEKVPTAI